MWSSVSRDHDYASKLVPAPEALASSELRNDLCLFDRPTYSLSIGRRMFGGIGCVNKSVKRGREVLGDVCFIHIVGP